MTRRIFRSILCTSLCTLLASLLLAMGILYRYYDARLLQELYTFSNPIVIKAALNLLGLPGGHLRKPYEDYSGAKLEHLKETMTQMGVIEKYHISNDHIEV